MRSLSTTTVMSVVVDSNLAEKKSKDHRAGLGGEKGLTREKIYRSKLDSLPTGDPSASIIKVSSRGRKVRWEQVVTSPPVWRQWLLLVDRGR